MFGEVVAGQDVEQVGVAAQVGVGERDQLAFTGTAGELRGAVEVVAVVGEHRGGDQDGGRVRRRRLREHLGGCVRVTADEAVKEGGRFLWHTTTVAPRADGALTTD